MIRRILLDEGYTLFIGRQGGVYVLSAGRIWKIRTKAPTFPLIFEAWSKMYLPSCVSIHNNAQLLLTPAIAVLIPSSYYYDDLVL